MAGAIALSGTVTSTLTGTIALTGPIVAAKFVSCLAIPVRSVSAMLRIVLPLPLASLTSVNVSVGVAVNVSVELVFVVDVDIAVVPIAIAPIAANPRTQGKSRRPPGESHARIVPGIGIRIIRIRRRRWPINNCWVVGRNINYIGLRGLNYDHLLAAFHRLGLYYLLLAGF